MGQPIELVPLVCVKCSTRIPAEPDEVAWVCGQCGQAMHLDEENGLAAIPVSYTAGILQGKKGKPYWVADGQVTLHRETYSGNESQAAAQFWAQQRRFFVPAFTVPLDQLLNIGMDLLVHPPNLLSGPATSFEPVTLHMDDVKAAAEFLVVAVEAGRADKLKKVDFSINLSTPALWILT